MVPGQGGGAARGTRSRRVARLLLLRNTATDTSDRERVRVVPRCGLSGAAARTSLRRCNGAPGRATGSSGAASRDGTPRSWSGRREGCASGVDRLHGRTRRDRHRTRRQHLDERPIRVPEPAEVHHLDQPPVSARVEVGRRVERERRASPRRPGPTAKPCVHGDEIGHVSWGLIAAPRPGSRQRRGSCSDTRSSPRSPAGTRDLSA